MAVTLTPTAGVLVQVSDDVPATFDAAGYEAVTWTNVSGFETVPNIGDGYEMAQFDSVTDGRIPYRAIQTGGDAQDINIADDPEDPGQILMKAAFDAAKGSTAERLAFRIMDQNDNYTAAQVLVGTWERQFGGASDIIRRMATVQSIPGTIVEATEA